MNIVPIDSLTPAPNSMLDYALRYAALGWHVFPVWGAKDGKCKCRRLCKSPGKHPVESIAPQGQDNATIDPATIRRMWNQMPDAGIALFLRPSGLCAIDIDPRNGGMETIESIESQHGPLVSDVMAFTQGGGEHRVFKLQGDLQLPGKLGPGVDVKRNGYIVLAPTQGVSGVYDWEASSEPLDGAIPSPLPDWIRGLATATVTTPQAATATDRFVTPEQVLELKEALSYLSADDYHAWINTGQALRSIGSQGFGLWDTWSQISEKYDSAEMGRKWRSFKPGAFNIESIFKLAQVAGWVNPLSKAAVQREEALKQLVAEHATIKSYAPIPEPVSTLADFPVPLLNDMSEWICRTQGIKNSVAVQMSVIALASLAVSRNYVSTAGDGAHLYQLVSAQTIGELRPLHNAMAQIISESGLRKLLREQRFSSPATFFKTLMRAPATLYLAPDWGSLSAFARRQPSGALEHLLHLISNVFSQQDIFLDNPEELGIKAAAGVTNDMPVIRRPAFSIFALAPSGMLTQSFSATEIGRGAVEQFIFNSGNVEFTGDPVPEKTPHWMIDYIRKVRGVLQNSAELDLASIFNGNAELMPTQTVVHFEIDPSGFYSQFDALGLNNRQARPMVIAARTNLRRIAVAIAVWANPSDAIVTRSILEWCAGFIGARLIESLGALNLLGGSDDGKQTLYQAVLEAIAEAGTQGLTPSDLRHSSYKFRSLVSNKREEMISLLIEDGQVTEIKNSNGKGKRLICTKFVQETKTNDANDEQMTSARHFENGAGQGF